MFKETSFLLFPVLYRASPGTDCREGAGLGGQSMFCPKMSWRRSSRSWVPPALQLRAFGCSPEPCAHASHSHLLKAGEIAEGIRENPKAGQSLIPLTNPGEGLLCSPHSIPCTRALGPEPGPGALLALNMCSTHLCCRSLSPATALRPQRPEFEQQFLRELGQVGRELQTLT